MHTYDIPMLQINVSQTSPANHTIYPSLFMLMNFGVRYTYIKPSEYEYHQNRPKSTSQTEVNHRIKPCAQKQNISVSQPIALNVLHVSYGQNCCKN